MQVHTTKPMIEVKISISKWTIPYSEHRTLNQRYLLFNSVTVATCNVLTGATATVED